MNIDEFLEKLAIASEPDNDQHVTDENTSAAYSAIQCILKDKNSIFVIIDILINSQNYSEKIIFLTQSVLRQLIPKMYLLNYTPDILDIFSENFFNFIDKFKEHASVFSLGIITFAKAKDYESKYILPVEQLALEKLNAPNGEIYEYEFATSTLKNLVSFYIETDDTSKQDFFNRVRDITLPYFSLEFTDYRIPTHIISIYTYIEILLFNQFAQDLSILEALLSVLYNAEKLQITDFTFIYFDKILRFFNNLLVHCKQNTDNCEQRSKVLSNFSIQILQVLPKFCFYMTDFIEEHPNTRFLVGQSFSIICRFFNVFQALESYDTELNLILQSIICFSRIAADDISDLENNIYNYYITAFVIESNSIDNVRSNSIILLRLISMNKDQNYINHIIEIFIQMEASEEIFFLLAYIIDLIEDEGVKEAVHKYVINLFDDSFDNFPKHTQFSFIFLASRSMFLFSEEESLKMLSIAITNFDKLKTEEVTPIVRFYVTISSTIIESFITKYKALPQEMVTTILELSKLSFSSTTILTNSIFEIYPNLFEEYQNYIVQQSISRIHEIITDESEQFLTQRQRELVESSFDSILYQSSHPSPNFPGSEIATYLNECFEHDHLKDFVNEIVSILSVIISEKANGLEDIINLSVRFFEQYDSFYYSDTVKPILEFILYDLDSSQILDLLAIAINNAKSFLTSFCQIKDDDSIPDFIACSTLISRLIQKLADSLPSNVYDEILKLIEEIRDKRDDLVSDFFVYEIYASLTFYNKGEDMSNEIDKWIYLCNSGVLNTDYYFHLHFMALNFLAETFPDRSDDLAPVIEILSSNPESLVDDKARLFISKYAALYSYDSFTAPFEQIC